MPLRVERRELLRCDFLPVMHTSHMELSWMKVEWAWSMGVVNVHWQPGIMRTRGWNDCTSDVLRWVRHALTELACAAWTRRCATLEHACTTHSPPVTLLRGPP